MTVDDHVGRLAELARAPRVPLGEAALVVSAALGDDRPVADGIDRLAALAAEVDGHDLPAVTRHLFATVGLRGDTTTYYDPANSSLASVLDRRRGIPVTLAVIAVDVARRLDIEATVVGMPGHVLIGDGDPPRRWCDGFTGGAWFDQEGARRRFVALHGDRVPFDRRYLAATPDVAVLARLLNNLVAIHTAAGDARQLLVVRRLRAVLPGVGVRERPELAAAYEAVGRFTEAAEVWAAEAAAGEGATAERAAARSQALEIRLN